MNSYQTIKLQCSYLLFQNDSFIQKKNSKKKKSWNPIKWEMDA